MSWQLNKQRLQLFPKSRVAESTFWGNRSAAKLVRTKKKKENENIEKIFKNALHQNQFSGSEKYERIHSKLLAKQTTHVNYELKANILQYHKNENSNSQKSTCKEGTLDPVPPSITDSGDSFSHCRQKRSTNRNEEGTK